MTDEWDGWTALSIIRPLTQTGGGSQDRTGMSIGVSEYIVYNMRGSSGAAAEFVIQFILINFVWSRMKWKRMWKDRKCSASAAAGQFWHFTIYTFTIMHI